MVSVLQVQFHYVRNGSCFVRGTIYIADGNWVRERPGGEATFFYILPVNIPVALESSRAVTDLVSAMSVVWSSILRVRERRRPSFSSKVSMTRWSGIRFSQLGFCLWEGAGGSV